MRVLTGIILLFILLSSFYWDEMDIVRLNSTSFHSTVTDVHSIEAELNDTIVNKIIKMHCDKDGYPVKYSRDIVTGVCIDGECRLVKINLFWNTTGRYLGFELPDGEFLSKTEHDPFSAFEYDHLHELLAEANSPLASYTIEELVPSIDTTLPEVDAVTSATIDAVLDHIVEGAVYTTYTLWHIVYGPTQKEIEKLTGKKLDAELCLRILESNILKDQIWTLNQVSPDMSISTELQNKLMELIAGNDVYLAERSLNALKPKAITDEIQLQLSDIFQNSGFLQKRLIIQKLKECNTIDTKVVQALSAELSGLNGTLTKNLLELYGFHSIEDNYMVSEVVKLLKDDNRYIADQAIRYLESIENPDKKTARAMEKYKKRNS